MSCIIQIKINFERFIEPKKLQDKENKVYQKTHFTLIYTNTIQITIHKSKWCTDLRC